jgi:hypothetical protein
LAGMAAVGDEVAGAAGGGFEVARGGAVETVTDAEAVAGELINRGDHAAGVRAVAGREVERRRGVREGAVVVDFAGEVDGVVGRGEMEFHALEDEVGRGLAVEFGADGEPFSGETHKGGRIGNKKDGRDGNQDSSEEGPGRVFLARAPSFLRSSTWASRLPLPDFSLFMAAS